LLNDCYIVFKRLLNDSYTNVCYSIDKRLLKDCWRMVERFLHDY